jgi:hypothetical protein
VKTYFRPGKRPENRWQSHSIFGANGTMAIELDAGSGI